MKAKVIEDACISCGACQAIAPDVFELNDSGIAVCNEEAITDDNKDSVIDASESCPTSAIEVEE